MPKSTFISYCGLLNKRTIVSATVLFLSISQVGYAAPQASKLKVTGGQVLHYNCDNGKKVSAYYYSLSDNSLSFVKLSVDGKEHTLPQVVAASGARYTDERKMEWWLKGDKAMLDDEVVNDSSKLAECEEASVKKAKDAAKAQQEAKEAAVVQAKKAEVAAKAQQEAKEAAAVQAKKAEVAAKAQQEAKEAAAVQAKKAEVAAKAQQDAKEAVAAPAKAAQEAKDTTAASVKKVEAVAKPKQEAKGAVVKQVKKTEAAVSAKKDVSTSKEK